MENGAAAAAAIDVAVAVEWEILYGDCLVGLVVGEYSLIYYLWGLDGVWLSIITRL